MAIKLRVREDSVRLKVSSDAYRLSASEGVPIYPNTYTGDLVITPRAWNEQILNCSHLMMPGDVTVLRVPYYETSNVQSGMTVYIADEL